MSLPLSTIICHRLSRYGVRGDCSSGFVALSRRSRGSVDTRNLAHYNYVILPNVSSCCAGKRINIVHRLLRQFVWYSLYVKLSFLRWAFSFCRLCSCPLGALCHDNIRHKASETLRMFSTEPDASDLTNIYATGLRPGCSLPSWTPSLAMDVEYILLFDVSVCQQTTRDDTSAEASHQQRTAIS